MSHRSRKYCPFPELPTRSLRDRAFHSDRLRKSESYAEHLARHKDGVPGIFPPNRVRLSLGEATPTKRMYDRYSRKPTLKNGCEAFNIAEFRKSRAVQRRVKIRF